jgi:hypothetical protein
LGAAYPYAIHKKIQNMYIGAVLQTGQVLVNVVVRQRINNQRLLRLSFCHSLSLSLVNWGFHAQTPVKAKKLAIIAPLGCFFEAKH